MFTDRLQAKLTLSVAGTDHPVQAGAISALKLTSHTYGFDASVTFVVSSELSDDPMLQPFNGSAALWVVLELANGRLAASGEEPVVRTWGGWAIERSFVETSRAGLGGAPVVQRAYTIRFADPATALWTVHRPLGLYAGESIRSVLEAQAVEGMQLTFDWPELDVPEDLFCLGMEGEAGASFYDFVAWFLADRQGVMELAPSTGTYRIARTKSSGTAQVLPGACVGEVRVQVPAWHRHTTSVVNPFSEATSPRQDVANAIAARGVRRDVVVYTQVPRETDERVQLEQERLRQPGYRATVVLRTLPDVVPVPATMVSLRDAARANEYLARGPLRVRSVELSGRNVQDTLAADEADLRHVPFELSMTMQLEAEGDPAPHLPTFEPPSYPVMVEGKVLSASGTADDRTWHAQSDGDDSSSRYRVHVPLWNKDIRVPFLATGVPGHFFFPAVKDQRVLLAIGPTSARIVGFLDWIARLDTDSQGNQITMGKRPESRTVMRHRYTDESPEFALVRTQWGDVQTLELSEGRFFLEVKEEPTQSKPAATYDLTLQADAAKDAASSESRRALGDLATTFGEQRDATSTTLASAQAELETSAQATAGALKNKIQATSESLSTQGAGMQAARDDLQGQFTAAHAALDDLLGE